MIGKKFLTEKIEEIYNYVVEKLIRGHTFHACADSFTDFLWNKYQRNATYFHQALVNILYSLKRLYKGNEDVVFFDALLREQFNFNQYVSFLAFREIFQSTTKITIMGSSSS